jgi:hypothetical protein
MQGARIEWVEEESGLVAYYVNEGSRIRAVWAPQKGSQEAFLTCPIGEALYEGTRGPGKTDTLLMDFAQHVGTGFGAEWRGILFRKTYPELQDVIDKSKKWFPLIFKGAFFNEAKTFWEFKDGEKLFFRQFAKPSDYWSYHGHAYPWIGWEELTTWADDKCYKSMFSCSRSTRKGIPIKIRATTNPYGVGHNWVKNRWRLPVPPKHIIGKIIADSRDQDGHLEPPRVAVHGHLRENRILLNADPTYISRIRAAARNPAEREAWLNGSWDIVAGGMFDDVWYEVRNKVVVPKFVVPESWTIDRSFDWGSSKPFSVGWWAESDGTDLKFPDGRVMSTVRGDLFRIHEWYGWSGSPNEGLRMLAKDVARGIVERELQWGIHDRVVPGVADTSIFDEENGNSIAEDMAQDVRIDGKMYDGVLWERADKSPGSRKQGWEQIRKYLASVQRPAGSTREHAGLFICNNCEQWTRTVPSLPRSDKDLDDVDTEAEDHIGDETRYRVRQERRVSRVSKSTGLY